MASIGRTRSGSPRRVASCSLITTAERRPGARHCWITNAPGLPVGRWPGVVVEWRRPGGRWQGRALVVVLEGEDSRVICSWFDDALSGSSCRHARAVMPLYLSGRCRAEPSSRIAPSRLGAEVRPAAVGPLVTAAAQPTVTVASRRFGRGTVRYTSGGSREPGWSGGGEKVSVFGQQVGVLHDRVQVQQLRCEDLRVRRCPQASPRCGGMLGSSASIVRRTR
jgi:hypothetical protein